MHCAKLFLILAQERTNVFAHLSRQDYRNIRTLVIDAILHTDMVYHGSGVKDLNKLYDDSPDAFAEQPAGKLNEQMREILSTTENKKCVTRTLVHGADLSNPCKPWKISFAWAAAILKEFFEQGDQEKALGRPVGMMTDRSKVIQSNFQLGFIEFCIAPFVASYLKIFTNWRDLAGMLAFNVGEWARLAKEDTGKDQEGRRQKISQVIDKEGVFEIATFLGAKTSVIEEARRVSKQLPSGLQNGSLKALAKPAVQLPEESKQSKLLDDAKKHAVVREVRRWRENQEITGQNCEQHRELVLLLFLSDECVQRRADFIMKFNDSTQLKALEGPTTMQVLDAPTPEAQQLALALPDEPNTLTVASAPDIMRSQLDPDGFDKLLTSLLAPAAVVRP